MSVLRFWTYMGQLQCILSCQVQRPSLWLAGAESPDSMGLALPCAEACQKVTKPSSSASFLCLGCHSPPSSLLESGGGGDSWWWIASLHCWLCKYLLVVFLVSLFLSFTLCAYIGFLVGWWAVQGLLWGILVFGEAVGGGSSWKGCWSPV